MLLHGFLFAIEDDLKKLFKTKLADVRDEGKARYRHYLTLPSPKAFVVYESGGWRFFWNDPDAMTKALDRCAKEGKPCWLYAVDDRVVWSADAGKRIGSSAQLRGQ